jgi:hypothetical protein
MAAPTNKEKLLIQVLRKIPIFNGLALTQVKKIIGLCQHKSYKLGKRICESGSRPDEMFILLSGELAIITPVGLRVATILPITTSGYLDAGNVCKNPFGGFVEKPLAPEPFQQLVEQTLSLSTG